MSLRATQIRRVKEGRTGHCQQREEHEKMRKYSFYFLKDKVHNQRICLQSYVNFKNTQSSVSVNLLLMNPDINDRILNIGVEIIHLDLRVVVSFEEERDTVGLGRVTTGPASVSV